MFCAEDGDSFLLHFGVGADFNILIDMGRGSTYNRFIKADLTALSKKQRKLDLLVITHIDEDHIGGAIPFLQENGPDNAIIKIGEIWHNTYRHLQFSKPKSEISSDEERKALKQLISQNATEKDKEGWRDISVESGVSVGGLILKYGYNWNISFNGLAVCVDNQPELFSFPVKLTMLSPGKNELKELGRIWERKLHTIFYDFQLGKEEIFDDAFEYTFKNDRDQSGHLSEIAGGWNKTLEEYALREKKDNSKVNASSIAFIIEYDEKKLLFLGDAIPDNVIQELRLLKGEGKHFFDLVKISHHGSAGNTSTELLDLISARKYLISTNGVLHSHPAVETISKILVKSSTHMKELIFNYRIKAFEYLENADIQAKYNFTVNYLNEIEL